MITKSAKIYMKALIFPLMFLQQIFILFPLHFSSELKFQFQLMNKQIMNIF